MAFAGTQWFVGDLHFEHPGIVKVHEDGSQHRKFDSVEAHDEHVIDCWNKKVGPNDKVYVVGDVCMKQKGLEKVARLNGKKHLVAGNHDIYDTQEYLKYFYKVSAYRVIESKDTPRFLVSHMPVHPMEMDRFKFNVHGHLHSGAVQTDDPDWPGVPTPDLRYLCVSLEQTGFAPISLDEIMAIRRGRGL